MEQIKGDDALRERLFMKVARSTKPGSIVKTFKRSLEESLSAFDNAEWHEMRACTAQLRQIVYSIEDLLKEDRAKEAMELSEFAISRVEDTLLHVDDSNGDLGGVLEELGGIHLAACKAVKPDPVKLANKLFREELAAHFDAYYGAVTQYQDVLGPKGLAEYQRIAEAEWAKVEAIGPGGKDDDKHGNRWRLTRIMEQLAEQSGDLEKLVSIKASDLSLAYHYLTIAKLYKENGKKDQVIKWAEKGVKAFPKKTDERLREFLADEYIALSREDDAMKLVWKIFEDSPSLESYKTLKAYAERCKVWSTWREKALDLLEEQAKSREASRGEKSEAAYFGFRDRSTLVTIFLWEGDPARAWNEAKIGGCERGLWMKLAETREEEHPDEALSIYTEEVERLIKHSFSHVYDEPFAIIQRICKINKRTRREDDFTGYVQELKKRYKPKRNFMKLLSTL